MRSSSPWRGGRCANGGDLILSTVSQRKKRRSQRRSEDPGVGFCAHPQCAAVLQDLTVCRTRASRRSWRRSAACRYVTLIGCSLSSVASRQGSWACGSLWKMSAVAREVNRLPPNRDNVGGWAGPRQAMSQLGNYLQMTAISKLRSRPGDELVFADHLTLVRFFSTSSP